MRLIIQRVLSAGVKVNGEYISKIGPGICILLGLHKGDNFELVDKWADKALKIKLWPEIEAQTEEQKESNSPKGKGGWKTSVLDNNYEVLVVSNFTLYGILKGNKPDFHSSMSADEARQLYNRFVEKMQQSHIKEKIQGGQFQTYMNVDIVNDGPVTLCIDADDVNDMKTNQQKQKSDQQGKKQEDKKPSGEQQQEEKQKKPKGNQENKQKPEGEHNNQKKLKQDGEQNNQKKQKPEGEQQNQQQQHQQQHQNQQQHQHQQQHNQKKQKSEGEHIHHNNHHNQKKQKQQQNQPRNQQVYVEKVTEPVVEKVDENKTEEKQVQ